MENNNDCKCEFCDAQTNQYQIGRYTGYFCPECHPNIDAEKFMAEHYSNKE